jgi:hypothetical protein
MSVHGTRRDQMTISLFTVGPENLIIIIIIIIMFMKG